MPNSTRLPPPGSQTCFFQVLAAGFFFQSILPVSLLVFGHNYQFFDYIYLFIINFSMSSYVIIKIIKKTTSEEFL